MEELETEMNETNVAFDQIESCVTSVDGYIELIGRIRNLSEVFLANNTDNVTRRKFFLLGIVVWYVMILVFSK